MRKEELLEAVGFISEDLLQQTEAKPRTSRKTVGRLILIAATMAALAVSVAAVTGLFSRAGDSRPIGEVGIVENETVAPFEMDAEGNIILGGVKGQKVTMQVEIDPDAPGYLEEIYHIEPSAPWKSAGGASSGSLYIHYTMDKYWEVEGKPGRLRLHQSTTSNYIAGKSGENVVDLLRGLPAGTKLTTEKVTMAGMEMLKLTIPELPGYDENKGHLFCAGGETRLYWSDGQYLLQLDYPYWVTDAEAEKLLSTLSSREYVVPYPEDYGKVNTEKLSRLDPEFYVTKGKTGTVMANSVMGTGRFVYSDGNVYYGGDGKMIAYNLETGKVKNIWLPDNHNLTFDLFATDNYICYEDMRDALIAVPKEGGEPVVIYQGLGIQHLYAEGPVLYTNNAAEYLSRINLETGKEEILLEGGAYSYFVDDTYIYVCQGDGKNQVMCSPKDKIDFEPISLSFYPVAVLADGDTLYLAPGGKDVQRQVIRYKDGVETRLPVYSWQYQILGDQLIYLDEIDRDTLKSYDLNTGETKVLMENAVDFSILEGRYLGIECVDENRRTFPAILDLETGNYHEPKVK